MLVYQHNRYVKLIEEVLPICWCGTPETCLEWLLGYLTDLSNGDWGKYHYEDGNWGLIQIINGFLDEKGVVEHGTTCRCSWLTNKGKEVLEALREWKKHEFCIDNDMDTEDGKWLWEGVDE